MTHVVGSGLLPEIPQDGGYAINAQNGDDSVSIRGMQLKALVGSNQEIVVGGEKGGDGPGPGTAKGCKKSCCDSGKKQTP